LYNRGMKKKLTLLGAFALMFGFGIPTAQAEDYQLLRGKTELLVGQANDLLKDSFRKGSETYGAAFQYYFSLIYGSGTNLLARSESPTSVKLMHSYIDLVAKDYEAYTKVTDATAMAAATGSRKGHTGSRGRTKRLINAEKLGDKELTAAIKRWEKFVGDVKKSSKR